MGYLNTVERIETLLYNPNLQNTADLEAATKTITATAEATGIVNADYSKALTLPAPSDARLEILRIAARLAVTIDSMTAGTLNCRVYVDQQDANHRLFDLNWNVAGAKLAAQDTLAGTMQTIFNLLKNGAAHTFYFFFWVDAGNAVLSLVQLWEGVGSCNLTPVYAYLQINHIGWLTIGNRFSREGSGTQSQRFVYDVLGQWRQFLTAAIENNMQTHIVNPGMLLAGGGSVATDLNYLRDMKVVLRSE